MTTYTITPKLATTLTAGTRFRHDGHTHTITSVLVPGGWEVQCDGCIDDGNHSMDLFYVPDPDGVVDVIIEETNTERSRARGEGDAHRPERCPTCGCELAYPTAVHIVDCGEGSE